MDNRIPLLPLVTLALLLSGPAWADVETEAAALSSRVAAGTLAPDRLEVAALLGHEPAIRALGRRPNADALGRCGREGSVRLALAGARSAAARWGGEPAGTIGRALAAMEAWLACPCGEHAQGCQQLEKEVEELTLALGEDVEPGAPGNEIRLDDMERRSAIGLAVHAALMTVRAPLEQEPHGPQPAPGLALEAVGGAGAAEGLLRRAEAPQPSEAAAKLMLEGLAGGGHGRPSRETVAAGKADLQRWQEELAAFERAARGRVLGEVRAAYLPWLLSAAPR